MDTSIRTCTIASGFKLLEPHDSHFRRLLRSSHLTVVCSSIELVLPHCEVCGKETNAEVRF